MNSLLSAAQPNHVIPPCLKQLPISPSDLPGEESCFWAAGAPGVHRDSCFEMLFVEAGEGWYWVGERKVWAGPGDLFLSLPGEIKAVREGASIKTWRLAFAPEALALSQTDADRLLPLPNELLLLPYLQSQPAKVGYFQVALVDRPRWLAWLQQLKWELQNKPLRYTETVRALSTLLLVDTARLVAPQLRQYSQQFNPLLTRVFHFIEAQYRCPIGLCDVAKAVDRSPAYLTDMVRRKTGRTVLVWIIERRMVEARRLLLTTNQSVQQIAKAVGYLDTGHFIYQFRRLHEKTPQLWRYALR